MNFRAAASFTYVPIGPLEERDCLSMEAKQAVAIQAKDALAALQTFAHYAWPGARRVYAIIRIQRMVPRHAPSRVLSLHWS